MSSCSNNGIPFHNALDPAYLFDVREAVVVVTGGGTGERLLAS
jgi:hypothetical protein